MRSVESALCAALSLQSHIYHWIRHPTDRMHVHRKPEKHDSTEKLAERLDSEFKW
jgi:hypothetical protein